MTFWRRRRLAEEAAVEAEKSKESASRDLKNALAMFRRANAQAEETGRIIRENHVQQHLQKTFSKGQRYGI